MNENQNEIYESRFNERVSAIKAVLQKFYPVMYLKLINDEINFNLNTLAPGRQYASWIFNNIPRDDSIESTIVYSIAYNQSLSETLDNLEYIKNQPGQPGM